MKEGMTWAFRGGFNGPLQATSWSNRFSSQANPETVERSRVGVLVATLYAHPLFTLSLRDSIRRQLDQAEEFVKTHPQWIIARSAHEAIEARRQGKRIIILALEGASGILENESDLREFIDQRGVRIVTFLHLTDDEFGGVAFLPGFRILSSPIAFLRNLFLGVHDPIWLNDQGLTEQGRAMARALIARKVWIDLAHASDVSQRNLIPMLREAGQPLLYTHTVLRRYLKAERAISDVQLEEVSETHGFIGLMPSEEMLAGTPVREDHCPTGGLQALALQYNEVRQLIGPESIALGSDYNGGIPHLRPTCGTGTSLDRDGLWNIGQVPELWQALTKAGAKTPSRLSSTIDRFLAAWSRVAP
jgi:microsomal dipeptidase-like Zn-dependent dipeptidase